MKTFPTPRVSGGFFSHLRSVALVILIIFGAVSCEEPDEVGINLVDRRASFGVADTLTIRAYTSLGDSVPTNLSTGNILGVINDPVFGKVKADLFTEFRLPRNDFSIGEDPKLDSVVLSFGYSGRYYGQIETFQRILVYELSENFPDKDTLYSNLTLSYHPDPVGEKLLRPAPRDSVPIDTIMVAPHFSIRLSDAFGQKILDANGTDAFLDIPSFLEYFKGFYIKVDDNINGPGSIFNINMASSFTRLSLYYHEDEENHYRQDFYITEFTKRSGYFTNLSFDGANPVLLNQLSGQDPLQYGDSLLFVQSMDRLRVNLNFPFIKNIKEGPGLIMNQARLIIPVNRQFSTELFPEASRLLLYRYDADSNVNLLPDMMIGDEYFGGRLVDDKGHYTFNITSYLQQLLDGKLEDYGLLLVVAGSSEGPDRVVLNGPGLSSNAMKLEIIYTIFN